MIIVHAGAQSQPPRQGWTAALKVVDGRGQPVAGATMHVYYRLTNEIVGKTARHADSEAGVS